MRVQIVGAGAIGCFLGSRLAAVDGVDVTLVGRSGFVDAVATQGGLRVQEGDTATIISEVNATTELSGEADLIIVAVKSNDTAAVATQISSTVDTDVLVLSVQNGVGNEEILVNAGCVRVVAGSLTTPVSVLAPAFIRIDKANSSAGIASWTPDAIVADVDRVHTLFASAGFEARRYDSADSMKWTKLLMNIVGNASSAILDKTPGEVFSDPRLVDLEIEAWRETLRVMKASSIKPVKVGSYPFNILGPAVLALPKAAIRPVLRSQVVGGRGDKMPSLHIDVYGRRGRSESAWLNGAVVDHGKRVDVETPINQVFAATVANLVGEIEVWDSDRLLRAASI